VLSNKIKALKKDVAESAEQVAHKAAWAAIKKDIRKREKLVFLI
jgi:cation transport regulator ChaB